MKILMAQFRPGAQQGAGAVGNLQFKLEGDLEGYYSIGVFLSGPVLDVLGQPPDSQSFSNTGAQYKVLLVGPEQIHLELPEGTLNLFPIQKLLEFLPQLKRKPITLVTH